MYILTYKVAMSNPVYKSEIKEITMKPFDHAQGKQPSNEAINIFGGK